MFTDFLRPKPFVRFAAVASVVFSLCLLGLPAHADNTVSPEQNLTEQKPEHAAKTPTSVINVNSADAALLAKSLKGVGMKKAEAIIRYREINGSFTKLEDLTKVKGIGQSIVNRNKVAIAF